MPVATGTNYSDHIPNPCHGAFAVLADVEAQAGCEGRGFEKVLVEPAGEERVEPLVAGHAAGHRLEA